MTSLRISMILFHLLIIVLFCLSLADAAQVNVSFAYDNLNRLASATYTVDSNSSGVAYGYDALGNIITQTVACTPLGAPTLITPANEAANVSITPVLDWGEVAGALSYDVQVCSDSGCSTVIRSVTGVEESQWSVSPVLAQNTSYWWRARGANACGPGSWSGLWRFTTTPNAITLAVNKQGNGFGTITSNPPGIACGGDCDQEFNQGTVVTLTASADQGSTFTTWTNCDSPSGNTCITTVTANKTVTANFALMSACVLTVSTSGGTGTGTVTGYGINCGTDCSESLAYGTEVILTATPGTGSTFASWTGCEAPIGSVCIITMNTANSVTAVFNLQSKLDEDFNPDANSEVTSIAVQQDGKILIGGYFTSMGGVSRNRIARLNGDGTLDTDFDPNAGSDIDSIVIQPDGNILVAGSFTTIQGLPRYHIARLNPNSTLDTGFTPSANSDVKAISLQPDGKILIGGYFTSIGDNTRNGIARLDAEGTLDLDFDPDIGAEYGFPYVYSIAIQLDGKILIGGYFTAVSNEPRNNIARLNNGGSLDMDFNPDPDGMVQSIAIQPDGKILISGGFTTVAGISRNGIARLNTDGTLDTDFDPNAGSEYGSSSVYSIIQQADSKILVGGPFTTIGGISRNGIARLNADGSLDVDFDPNINENSDWYPVYSLAMQTDGKILIGGYFNSFDGEERRNIARVTNTDLAMESFNLSSDGSTVTWTRGQASPEVWRVTFEQSSNGADWTSLGNGTRVAGGWQLTGLSLPFNQNLYVRARGYATGGIYNGSSSIHESIKMFHLIATTVPTDFNGDGNPDILWRNALTGDNVIWLMNGTNWLNSVWLGSVSDVTWSIVGVSDFNKDTYPDILWRNTTSGDNVIWLMDGTNWLNSVWLGSVADVTWSIVGVGDFNGDTFPDIVWRNTSSGDNVIWLMNGTNWTTSVWLGSVSDTTWSIVGVGDFNKDTYPDILWRNTSTGDNVIWLMNGTNWLNSVWLGSVSDTTWSIVGVADFNHDTSPDILWRNTTTGDNVIWLMNGTNWLESVWLPAVLDTTWAIVGQ